MFFPALDIILNCSRILSINPIVLFRVSQIVVPTLENLITSTVTMETSFGEIDRTVVNLISDVFVFGKTIVFATYVYMLDFPVVCVKLIRETSFISMLCNVMVHIGYCVLVLKDSRSQVGFFFDTTERRNPYANSTYIIGVYQQNGVSAVSAMGPVFGLVMEAAGCMTPLIGLDAQIWDNRPESPLCYCIHENHMQLITDLPNDSVFDTGAMVDILQNQCFWNYFPTQIQVSGTMFLNPYAAIIFPMTIGAFFSFTVFSLQFLKQYVTSPEYQNRYWYVFLLTKGSILMVGGFAFMHIMCQGYESWVIWTVTGLLVFLKLGILSFFEKIVQSYSEKMDSTDSLVLETASVWRIYESVYLWVMIAGDLVTVFMIMNMYAQTRYIPNSFMGKHLCKYHTSPNLWSVTRDHYYNVATMVSGVTACALLQTIDTNMETIRNIQYQQKSVPESSAPFGTWMCALGLISGILMVQKSSLPDPGNSGVSGVGTLSLIALVFIMVLQCPVDFYFVGGTSSGRVERESVASVQSQIESVCRISLTVILFTQLYDLGENDFLGGMVISNI